jgi:Domain of unknown function (DUF1772)
VATFATFIGAVIPFTFIVIMPTNQKLLAPERDISSIETSELLVKWGKLHAVRSVLSFIALVNYVGLSLKALQIAQSRNFANGQPKPARMFSIICVACVSSFSMRYV